MPRALNTEDILSLLFFEWDDTDTTWTAEEALGLMRANGYERAVSTVATAMSRLSILCYKSGLSRIPVLEHLDRGKYKISRRFLEINKKMYAPWRDAGVGYETC